VVHELPGDLRRALIASRSGLDTWNDITPLARNEFVCWAEDAKQEETRARRIRRTQEELEAGQRPLLAGVQAPRHTGGSPRPATDERFTRRRV